jgi:hypothetical protein
MSIAVIRAYRRTSQRATEYLTVHHGLKSVEEYDGPKELRMAESQRKSERSNAKWGFSTGYEGFR